MAVVSVTERLKLAPTTSDIQTRRHQRVFLVVCNDVNDGPDTAHDATTEGVPDYGDTHPTDTKAIVSDKEVFAVDHLRYDVVVNYSTRVAYTGISLSGTTPQYAPVPTDRYPKYSWAYVPVQRPLERAITRYPALGGSPVDDKPRNSAGDVFYDPPVMKTFNLLRWTVSRWYAGTTNIYNMIEYYRDAVNSDHFVQAPIPGPDPPQAPGIPEINSAKIAISANDSWESGGYYWWVTFVIDFDLGYEDENLPDLTNPVRSVNWTGHQAYVIDAGYNFLHLPGDLTSKQPFRINGTKPTRPQNLASNGRPADAEQQQHYIYFQRYKHRDFAPLGLTSLTTVPWVDKQIP